MTDEQIKQNAEDYINENTQGVVIDANVRNFLLDVYLAGAHSRDEEIERLKNKLEGMTILKNSLATSLDIYDKDNKELQDELDKLRNPLISIEDRLPEKAKGLYELEKDEGHKIVLFKTANDKLFIGYLDALEIWRSFTIPFRMSYPIDSLTWSKVTHWMPIPELKKGE